MLDEAIAKYNKTIDEMHCFDPKDCQMCAEDKIALDAAVRAVALAAANWPTEAELDSCQIGATAESEIDRLLPEGSEGGTE